MTCLTFSTDLIVVAMNLKLYQYKFISVYQIFKNIKLKDSRQYQKHQLFMCNKQEEMIKKDVIMPSITHWNHL